MRRSKPRLPFLMFLAYLLLFFAFFSVSIAWAQDGTTSLRGTITDKSGGPVPGAVITLENSSLGISLSTTTDNDGTYKFVEIKPTTYTLTAKANGFATITQTGLQLLVATPSTDDLKLELASVATSVEVVGILQSINTTDATIGNAFNQSQISALPFEGRDPAGILSLQPGVVTVADRGKVDTNGDSRGGAVNGARSDQTNITLDGIGDNDEVKGTAFQGALRATLDSIEEFRVITSNSDADQGRSSGAQVQLVTKSGTNQLHGTAYEYNRPTNTVANDYFNKHAELSNGRTNTPPRLLRNTFGGSGGGHIIKDRLFFFAAYEGQRTRESFQVTRSVPSDSLRDGVIEYVCDANASCPGGSVQGLSGANYSFDPGTNALGPSQIASMDANCTTNGTCPLGPGVNPNVIATLQQYPHANSNQLGDGLNYRAFTFSAGTPEKLDTYITKFDLNITKKQTLFVRLGLQNDHGVPTTTPGDNIGTNTGAPQFPGQPSSTVATNNTKGIVSGYQWTISPTKVNSIHYGYIRQGLGINGGSVESFVRLRGLDTPVSDSRTTSTIVPVHNITDDFTWIRGKHTFQFGGNYRLITNNNSTNANSFTSGLTNTGFLVPTGISNVGGSLDPAAFGFPAVDAGFQNSYDYPMMALAGIITEVDTVSIQNKSGEFQPAGSFVKRSFRNNELEAYAQDSWHMKSNITFTYGLRYALLQPPYERNGNQVNPSISLDNFFKTRMKDMVQGISYSPDFSMDLSGPANGKPGFWGVDYKNLAPRLSMAWSPAFKDGLLGSIFGGPGKSSVRWGAGVYYDHFGQGVITTYDQQGSFGFLSSVSFPPGTVNVDNAPRYTGLHDLPPSLLFPPPSNPGFPSTPPDAFAIYWGLDDKLKTPYSYAFDFSISRELKSGFSLEVAYVGRLGRRLLQEKDLAQPVNLTDPKTGLSYFQAVTALAKLYRTGEFTNNFNPSQLDPKVAQYWTNIIQPLMAGGAYSLGVGLQPGQHGCFDPATVFPTATVNPVVAAYDLFCNGSLNETTPLSVLDTTGIPDANNAGVSYFPKNGPFSFYQAQDASLNAWTSTGRSNYNALQVMLRHRVTHGLTMDFNYTFSKSIDMGSAAERVSTFVGSFFGVTALYNPFSPGLFRSVSDFDTTHQVNADWVYELPIGRGHRLGASWNRAAEALLGGWTWSGLAKWTSGFPFGVQNGFQFPTNWDLNGYANLIGPKPKAGAFTDSGGDMNMFQDPQGAINAFDYPFPGQVGSRNVLRGPGYFSVDAALRKTFSFTERQKLSFSWEVFNVTNSVRFDVFSNLPAIDNSGSFGKYSQTLTGPRVMEFALRYSF